VQTVCQSLCHVVNADGVQRVVKDWYPDECYNASRNALRAIHVYVKSLEDMLHTQGGILTFDNYSHVYPESGVQIGRLVQYPALYTVGGVVALKQHRPKVFLL